MHCGMSILLNQKSCRKKCAKIYKTQFFEFIVEGNLYSSKSQDLNELQRLIITDTIADLSS